MTDFIDIFSKCEAKVKDTISFEPKIMELVQKVEAKNESKREYGDTFQSILESFKPNELPAGIVSVDRLGSTSDNNITAQDNYHIKCTLILVVAERTLQAALSKAQKIIFFAETVIKNQRSGQMNYSGFDGVTEIMPTTNFEYSEVNNKFVVIATMEFTILSIQEFVIS